MAGLNLTLAAGVLKDDYQPTMREQLNNSFALLDQIESNEKDTQGTAAVISIHTARNSGVGARPEGGTLPTAGHQASSQERITLKYNFGRMQLTEQTIKFLASDKGSFVRSVEFETKGIVRDLKRYVNTQLYTAQTGVIATTVGGATTTTVTLVEKAGARRIEVGGLYDIVDGTTDAIVSTVRASSVNISTLVFTFVEVSNGGHAAAAADRIVRSGVVPSGNYELLGLSEIIDSAGALHNLNPSTAGLASWSSYERAVTVAPSDSIFEEALDEIQIASGEDPDTIWTSYEVARAYANSLKTLKRFEGGTLELKGGWKATSVTVGRNTVGLIPERDCDHNVAYIVNTGHLMQFVASDWEFMDGDGSVLSRVSGVAAYEAALYKFHELATDRRNAHGKITGIVV
jgi:hypothetical protein